MTREESFPFTIVIALRVCRRAISVGEYSMGGPRKRFWVGSCNKVPTGVPTMLCVSRMTRITRYVRLVECCGEGKRTICVEGKVMVTDLVDYEFFCVGDFHSLRNEMSAAESSPEVVMEANEDLHQISPSRLQDTSRTAPVRTK